MDLCMGANGTLLTFPASPALCVCWAWSVNKPVCERGYLGDTTTITFHLFCVHTRFINLCTLSPLWPSCACSPAPVRPRKSTALGFVWCVCLCVCVFVAEKGGGGGGGGADEWRWSSNQFPPDRLNTVPHNCLPIEKAELSEREKETQKQKLFQQGSLFSIWLHNK